MNRLALMSGLQLTSKDSTHLLISRRIGSPSLRATAAALKVESIDHFLDKMHRIKIVSSDSEQRSNPIKKPQEQCLACGKPRHNTKFCSKSKVFCVYCKTSRHQRTNSKLSETKEKGAVNGRRGPARSGNGHRYGAAIDW